MFGKILSELLEAQYQAVGHPLTIVETGTMYYTTLEAGETTLDARSTFGIAQWIKKTGVKHAFHSVDFYSDHIESCKRALSQNGLDGIVEHHLCENAATALRAFSFSMDFVLLDTAIEPEYTLDEYLAIYQRIRRPGFVVIDDTHVPCGGQIINKGSLAMPFAVNQQKLHVWEIVKEVGTQRGEKCAVIPFGREAENIVQQLPRWFEVTSQLRG